MQHFFSNGKLLLTAEYLVLQGAQALAVPTHFGQSITVETQIDSQSILWQTHVEGNLWFRARFSNSLAILETNDKATAHVIQKLLAATIDLNPEFIAKIQSSKVACSINFPMEWGLGTSSSLISNVAYVSNVDPFLLLRKVSKGSGYDIACARAQSAILYELQQDQPKITPVSFAPTFKNQIYFAYLGQKQNSETSIARYLQKETDQSAVSQVTMLTQEMLHAKKLSDFNQIVVEHEQITGKILGEMPIKEKSFRNFDGEIKSLGAWGGDFVMITWKHSMAELQKILIEKNMHTLFRFDQILKSAAEQKPIRTGR